MEEIQQRVFLTGATGEIGSQTLKLLRNAKVPVRVLCRRQKQVDDFTKQGCDVVLGSLDQSAKELAEHMKNCDSLLLVTAATPDQLQHCLNATNAAISAGVRWIVKISAGDAKDEGNVPWVRAHAKADLHLRETAEKHKLSWTILSPSAFMQNLLAEAPAIRKGFLPQTGGNGKAGWIDTADIAAVCSRVLIDGPDKHDKQNYILTGPALISFPDIAKSLSKQIGHSVRYLHVPGPVFGWILRMTGADAWSADGLVAQFVEIVRPNKEGIDVSDAVENITGKAPTSIDEFAARNKDALAGFDVLPYLGAAALVSIAVTARAVMK